MDRESQLIERIARGIPSEAKGSLCLGIGDDAAILAPNDRNEWALSCDAFLEGVHFLTKIHPPDSVGYKSLVRATSDLVAMGATPRMFLLTLALPASRTGKWLNDFIRGMKRAARSLGVSLAGGDTSKSSAVSISVTVLGEVAPGHALKRTGARPGDIVYVSGRLGRAQLGLELILRGLHHRPSLKRFAQPHLYPRIRVELGAWLAQRRVASAMMDISDGLSTDLTRMIAASRVGARLWSKSIPCATVPLTRSKKLASLELDPLRLALHGGDDYGLLFTVPARKVKRLRKAPGYSELTAIGEITRGRQVLLVDANGCVKHLDPQGWDPFKEK
jgi:thiamine-monophosphate kinase